MGVIVLPIAFLFPGQGSQKVTMGLELFESSKRVREVFERANEALSFSLSDIMFHGPPEVLTLTQNAQPAILTHSIAVLTSHLEKGCREPNFVAGHSLGEYSALVAARVLSFEDAVKAVHIRGKLMQEAVPVGTGTMSAVLGTSTQVIEEVCASVNRSFPKECVEIANYNGPDQTVISGSVDGVLFATKALLEKGAKRIISLPVSAPFHCRLMEPAAIKLAEHLGSITFNVPTCSIINNVNADIEEKPDVIKNLLVKQVVSPVKFTQMLQRLEKEGVKHFVEMGPGKVLSGITRRTLSNVEITSKES